jgi:hypothetical protein
MLDYTERVLREKGRKLDDIALLTAEVYFNKGNYEKPQRIMAFTKTINHRV